MFQIQQIFTWKQYAAHRPDSQQPNPSDDLSIDKHWPWVSLMVTQALWLFRI